MVGGGAALYEGGGTLEAWAEEDDGEENDEHPVRAGNRVKDVNDEREPRAALPRKAPRPSVTRMRNPCVPMQEV